MLNALLFYSTYFLGLAQAYRVAPVYLFIVYQAVYFFNPLERWWSYLVLNISYSFYIVILMIIVVITKRDKISPTRLIKVPQFRWMYLLLALYAIAYFYAVDQRLHWKQLEVFIKLVITMSLAFKLVTSIKLLDYVLISYVYGATYFSFLAFQMGRNRGNRLDGLGMVDSPDANGAALAIVPALILSVHYFWVVKNWKIKICFLISTGLIANALVLINSRGAFLAAFAGLCFFMGRLFFTSVKDKFQKIKIVTFGTLGIMAAISLMDQSFIDRVLTITEETEVNEDRETGATRTIFWKATVDMSLDYPFGKGAKGFNYYAPIYIPKDIIVTSSGDNSDQAKMKSVHSSWFEALSEIGYPGMFVLFMMLIVSFRTTAETKKYLKKLNAKEHYYKVLAIEAALLSFMVGATFLNRMRAEVFYWCILFTACAYNVYVLQKKGKKVHD